jgi:hypothetical protein
MGQLDQLAAAGFSQQEMDGYAAQQRQQLSAGGFSDQEISSYLGGAQPEHPDSGEANKAFAQTVGNHLVDTHNLINVGTGKDAMQTMTDIGTVYAPLEAALNVATGTIFGFPAYIAGGAAGLADKFIMGDKTMDPAALAEKLSSAVTYQPKTQAGQRLAAAAQYPLQVLNDSGEAAGNKVADIGQSLGLSNTTASWAGAFTAAAIQTLPAVLLGELGRKMGGQRITADDMQNTARVIAGPDAHPDTVQSVENSLRATYQQTGIGPYTVLEQSRINPQIADDLKNPDIGVPPAFEQYARREQVGVPVSDAMKAVRPLEAETPVPGPVPEEAMTPEEIPQENGTLNPEEIQPETASISAEKPEAVFGGPETSEISDMRAHLNGIADRLGVMRDEVSGGFSSNEGIISIPPEDATVAGASSANDVFAHELGHAIMQKRGLNFSGFPKSEMEKWIPNWDQWVQASKDFRPDTHNHEDARIRRYAKKPNEIIADAIGSVLTGKSPEDLVVGKVAGLTRRDLGLPENFDQAYDEATGSVTLMHSGLSPVEAVENLKMLGGKILQTDIGQKVAGAFQSGLRDLQMKTIPMAAGSDRAMAIVKDAANAMRRAAWQWGAFDDLLKRGYTKEQRENMWNAADEENDLRTQGITDPSRGLGRLTDDERQTVQTLADYGNQLLGRARAVGMFQGEGVQYWTPRMIAMIGEDGEVSAPHQERVSSIEGKGGNITTSAGSLKGRKHATTAETEAAAKAKFGEGAQVVRDIRTMPLAMARIERAIAGRELVNRIKDVGLQLGQELVSTSEKPEMFTIDHPAFKTYRPSGEQWISATEAELSARGLRAGNGRVWKSNPDTVSEYDPVNNYRVTDDGKIERRVQTMERAPLYISKEFEGPLKSIMTEKSGPLYQALMGIKGRVMSMIMYSPLIHNMVEWGRALPMMPGKVLTGRVYFEGNAAKHDPVTMRRAIDNGLVPIGHRFANQDITGLLEEPNIQPGRGLVSKAVGGAVSMVNGEAGNAVKAAIDRVGDVWHNTLLWDRVADLQMGLYTNLERDMIGKGLPPQTAGRLAAHFANRYAGALPNEAMSNGARKLANLTLFSRTFTLGNIGAMKDILTGLPKDVQAQLVRDVGEAGRAGAVKAAQQKALHAFVMDIGLLYVGNSIMQNAMDYVMRDKTIPQILQGYATRFKDYLTRADKDPSAILDIGSIFPNSQNEPGKENRIFFNTAPDGTATYVRLPTGKIGEEFQGYLTSPLDMLKRKEGTLVRPLMQTLQNDKGFGRKVYDDQEPGIKGMMHAVGNVVWNILQEQIPLDSIQSGYKLLHGEGDDTDALKTVGPLLGLTFSKGAPGGPEVGVMFDAEKRHQNEVASAMPKIRESIKSGDIQDAITQMEDAHMTPQEQRATLKYAMNPQARLNRNRMKKFEQIAPTDDIERMEQMQEEEAQQSQSNQ